MQNYYNSFLVAFLMLLHRLFAQTPWNTFWVYQLNNMDDERQVHRLADLMRSYIERAEARWLEILPVKFSITEKSMDLRRAFEKGYIMGDIIENYRKATVFTQKQMAKKRYIEADRIRYMMYVQNAYIKAFHLVHMQHEIDPKYGFDNTGQMTKPNPGLNQIYHIFSPTHWNTSGFYYTKELDEIRQQHVKERKKKVDRERRLRKHELEVYGTVKPGTVKTTTNWWPVAYGWDIDYYW